MFNLKTLLTKLRSADKRDVLAVRFKSYGTDGCPSCENGRIGLWIKHNKCISCDPASYDSKNATTDILISELDARTKDVELLVALCEKLKSQRDEYYRFSDYSDPSYLAEDDKELEQLVEKLTPSEG